MFCLDAALSGYMSNLQDCVNSNRGSINTTFILMYHGRLNGGRTAVVENSFGQNLGILSSYRTQNNFISSFSVSKQVRVGVR